MYSAPVDLQWQSKHSHTAVERQIQVSRRCYSCLNRPCDLNSFIFAHLVLREVVLEDLMNSVLAHFITHPLHAMFVMT